ncbi:MAG: phage tail protein [Enterocloster bolteae]
MIKLHDGEIKDIMPVNLITPEVQALSYSVGRAMKKMLGFSAAAHLFANLGSVPETALDLIAVELNTQYYMQTLPRKTKEALISQTLQWYMHGGTPSVLEQFLSTILDGGRIDEWYKYEGAPYYFRAFVYVGEHETTLGYGTEVKRQIEKYKNVRSWIEWVAFVIASKFDVNVRYANIIRFQNIFHPRKNIAYLKLDGKWKLNGKKYLSGYDDELKVDFYPVRLQCTTYTDIKTERMEGVRIRIEAKKNPWPDAEVRYQTETENNTTIEGQITLSSYIQEFVSPGEIGVTNVNKLDTTWTLNGTRRLNGGYCNV